MKKFTTLFTAACISAALAFAQGPRPRQQGGTPPDPQTMIQNRVEHMATLLDLTDAQKTQATTIFTTAFTASQNIEPNLRTTRQSLNDAVKQNAAATIDQLSATLGSLTGQLIGINSKAEAAFYAILTADQQAKYDAMPHGGPGGPGPMMEHGGFSRFGGHGPRGQ